LICHRNKFFVSKKQKLQVFVFDEILLFTRIATRNGFKSYQLTNYPIPIELLRIEDIEDGVKIPELSSGSFSRTLAGSKLGKNSKRRTTNSSNLILFVNLARNVFRCSSLSSSDNNRNISMLLQARDIYDKQQWLSAFRSIMLMTGQ
jgi:hypothetical protein